MPDWSKMNLIPMNGLEAWYQVDPALNTSSYAPDYSGNGRHLTVASNTPSLALSPLNNELGYYFDGTKNPLAWSGSVTAKHVFMILAFDRPAFTVFEGVLSGLTTGNILTSENGGTKFFDFGTTGYEYRKADVLYAAYNLQAPVNGNFALIEQILPGSGIPLDGIQIGKQLVETPARLFKGWWMGCGIYSTLQNEIARLKWTMYAAMRFHLWPTVASGLNVFPFPSNKTRGRDLDQEYYLSEPYEGDLKALVRDDVDARQWPFALRIQEEYDAAEAFYRQHRPITPFMMRDYRFTPPRDTQSRFASGIREQGSEVTFRFNYSFDTLNV